MPGASWKKSACVADRRDRGTEKKAQDWLTDADCKPEEIGAGKKVHCGFLKALTVKKDRSDRTVKVLVESALVKEEARDADGRPLPVFITGHSLGGAMAVLTTVLVAPDVDGACYTYGAPRVANYEFFRKVKGAGVPGRELCRRGAPRAAGRGNAACARGDSGGVADREVASVLGHAE